MKVKEIRPGQTLRGPQFSEPVRVVTAEQEHGADFLRLANSLSALYPRGAEDKRLLDAMLLAVPR